MSNIILNCLVVGDDPFKNIIQVEINDSKQFTSLKEVIWKKGAPKFNTFAAFELTLWKINIYPGDENNELIRDTLENKIEEVLNGNPLPPLSEIREHFPVQLDRRYIHIIIRLPTIQESKHRDYTKFMLIIYNQPSLYVITKNSRNLIG